MQHTGKDTDTYIDWDNPDTWYTWLSAKVHFHQYAQQPLIIVQGGRYTLWS